MAAIIDSEVREIVMNQYEKAKDILNKNMDKVHKVAQMLFVNEKVGGDEFRAIMENTTEE
jgi:cell division protease FtsH